MCLRPTRDLHKYWCVLFLWSVDDDDDDDGDDDEVAPCLAVGAQRGVPGEAGGPAEPGCGGGGGGAPHRAAHLPSLPREDGPDRRPRQVWDGPHQARARRQYTASDIKSTARNFITIVYQAFHSKSPKQSRVWRC